MKSQWVVHQLPVAIGDELPPPLQHRHLGGAAQGAVNLGSARSTGSKQPARGALRDCRAHQATIFAPAKGRHAQLARASPSNGSHWGAHASRRILRHSSSAQALKLVIHVDPSLKAAEFLLVYTSPSLLALKDPSNAAHKDGLRSGFPQWGAYPPGQVKKRALPLGA